MTTNKGFIGGLPNYNVLKPQYNAELENIQRKPFKKTMTPNELGEKAGEILSMTNTEIMDIMADNLMKDFKFDMASKILECFGKQASQKELDNELWEAYSYAVEDNLQDGQLNESYFEVCTKHFDLSFSSKQECNCSMNAYVQLVPMRWVYESDVEVTESNYKDEVERCLAELYELAEKDANKIAEMALGKFDENKEAYIWDAPKHLMDAESVRESMLSVTKEYPNKWWEDNYEEFVTFGPYNAMGSSSGCFSNHIQNNNGKVKVILSFGTEYTSESYSNTLYNREAMYIDSRKE